MVAFWATALKPLFALIILTVIGIPVTMAFQRWMPDGPIKRTLLDRTLFERKKWIPYTFLAIFYPVFFGCVLWYMGG